MSNDHPLKGKTIALLATDGFEQIELTEPKRQFEEAGATVHVLSPKSGHIRGWNSNQWGEDVNVDRKLEDASVAEYDALVLPGGVINPDKLRLDEKAIGFIRDFSRTDKPLAAICHGAQLLIEAGVAKDHKLTSWPSVRTDVTNAGGQWVDKEVVVDGNLITSRKPDDIPAFVAAIESTLSSSAAGR